MKRLLLLLLALALLTGCGAAPTDTTGPNETTVPEPGIYTPGHTYETQSGGAVRVFPLEETAAGIAFMGKTLVTFSEKEDKTVLTPYVGENLSRRDGAQLQDRLLPGDKILRVDQQRIGYYNRAENCIVFLDSGLQETGRTQMPKDMVGDPAISENMATVFYCTASEVRAVSLESGINRLIRKQSSQSLSVEAVLMADSVLMYGVTDNDGNCYMEFISSQTGESLGMDRSFIALDLWQNQYFLQRQDGLVTEYIFTAADGSQQCFHPQADSQVYALLEMNAVATVTYAENGAKLQLFDLSDGKCKAQLVLEGVTEVTGLISGPQQELVWFLCREGEDGKQLLCSWDGAKSPVADDAVYTAPRYTAQNPDTAGLNACREKADDLEKRFGVDITFGTEPLQSADYGFHYEHQPSVIMNALEQLEQAMSIFPEGFLVTAAEISDSKQLHIGLVRSLKSKNTGVPDGIDAVQYWVDGDAWMALSVGETVQQLFIHELAHVLDTFVYSKNVAYDEWSKLNPKDFSYDLSYFSYRQHEGSQYLSGKEQAFIDTYSMTYPKEDRARIFDCALAEGNEALFASKTMQAKLKQFCVGLRNAYGWKKDERSFLWEQYLETPLAYTKK